MNHSSPRIAELEAEARNSSFSVHFYVTAEYFGIRLFVIQATDLCSILHFKEDGISFKIF
jgi:hypothetical protein